MVYVAPSSHALGFAFGVFPRSRGRFCSSSNRLRDPTTGHPFLMPLRRRVRGTLRFVVICAVVSLRDCSLGSTQTMFPIEPCGSRDTFLDFRNPSTLRSSLFRLLPTVLLRVLSSASSGLASPTVESSCAEALFRFRAHLPTVFQVGSSLGFLPSEVSLRPRRRTLSGRAFLLAVIRLALDRLRGFEHREPFAADLSAFVSWTPRR
jgi:hypothetical protein